MVNRQRLLWAIATRKQLERWEPLVASFWRADPATAHPDEADIWSAEIEHHFALVAVGNLFQALDFAPAASVSVDQILRAELIQRPRPPRTLAREHAGIQRITAHGTAASPLGKGVRRSQSRARAILVAPIGSQEGRFAPAPHVPASALHRLLDAVEAEVLTNDDSLRRFVPRRAPSPWLHENGKWWPKPAARSGGAAPALG